MRLSQLTTALNSTYADSAFVRDLKRAVAQTIEALADQDFGANGFDYEACPYDAYQNADFADICAALDFSGYAEMGPKACFADCFGQFAEMIFTQTCEGITKSFCLKDDLYTLTGFVQAYEDCRDLLGCGAIYQLIRACNNLEAGVHKADLLSILGPKSYVAFRGMYSLIVSYACDAKRKVEDQEHKRIMDSILGK